MRRVFKRISALGLGVLIFALTLTCLGGIEMKQVSAKPAVQFKPFAEIAAGKSVTADSTAAGSNAANAVDGNESTSWKCSDKKSGRYIQVDLGGLYEIEKVNIKFASDAKITYCIEATDHFSRWLKIADKEFVSPAGREHTVDAKAAGIRYVRITFFSQSTGDSFEIKELSIMGREEEFLKPSATGPEQNGVPRPVISPIPATVDGVDTPVLSLDGDWKSLIPENLALKAVRTTEGASDGEKSAVTLTWGSPTTLGHIHIYDNSDPNINLDECVLVFSDGSSFDVKGIPQDGKVKRVSFPKKTVKWVKLESSFASSVPPESIRINVFGDVNTGGFWYDSVDTSSWETVNVPKSKEKFSEFLPFYGVTLPSYDSEIPHKRDFTVPASFKDKRVILKIDKSPTFSRVWIDGRLVKTHEVGFSLYEVDITEFVTAGETHTVTIGTVNEKNSIEDPFIYGQVGSVTLIAQPKTYLAGLETRGTLDESFKNGILKLRASVIFDGADSAEVKLSMKDKDGKDIKLSTDTVALKSNGNPILTVDGNLELSIPDVYTWDAENPNLYTLTASLVVGGKTVSTVNQRVGFRTIVFEGNQMFVNGNEVKLRGMSTLLNFDCRLDEVELFKKLKAANINCIITTHYPLDKRIIDLCDEMGMYMIMEPHGFILGNVPNHSFDSTLVDDPLMTSKFMTSIAECIETYTSNTCVFMYSIGDEAWYWGSNVQKVIDYIKAVDPERKWLYNFDYKIPEDVRAVQDIISIHYPHYNNDTWGGSHVPEMYDQYATIFHSQPDILRLDPGVRNSYANTINKFWEKVFTTKGALGGTIWNVVDDAGRTWGMFDMWGREKPEYWGVKKGYSPIRIEEKPIVKPEADQDVVIDVKNWFDSTNFSGLKIEWKVGSNKGVLENVDIAPHADGQLKIPAKNLKDGDVLELRFYKSDAYMENQLIDGFNLSVGELMMTFEPLGSGDDLNFNDNGLEATVTGKNFKVVFDSISGKITTAEYNGKKAISNGPHLNLGMFKTETWTSEEADFKHENGVVTVTSKGRYGSIGCEFVITIDGAGLISTTYKIKDPPDYYNTYMDKSGYTECGIYYTVPPTVKSLSWYGKSQWSFYPDTDIARPAGVAPYKRSGGEEVYNTPITDWAWSLDEKDFVLWGKESPAGATRDFKSSKWNLYFANLKMNDGASLRLEGDGTVSARAEVQADGQIRYNLNNQWAVPLNTITESGDPLKDIHIKNGYQNTINMRLTDGDEYFGTYDLLSGKSADSEINALKPFTYDMGAVKSVDKITVDGGLGFYLRQYENDTAVNSVENYIEADFPDYNGYAAEYKIELSEDNSTFKEVAAELSGSGVQKTYTFTAVNARYVRISVLATDTETSFLSSKCVYDGNAQKNVSEAVLSAGASVSFMFRSPSIIWTGEGSADIYIDGEKAASAQSSFSKHGLPAGVHEIKVVAVSDGVKHTGFGTVLTEKLESWDSRITYSKKTPGSPGATGQGAHDIYDDWFYDIWSAENERKDARTGNTTGITAELKFTGTGVRWYGSKTINGGTADVYIDGNLAGSVNQRDTQDAYRLLIFEAYGLQNGEHTLKIVTTSAGRVDVDWFERIYEHSEEYSLKTMAFSSAEKVKITPDFKDNTDSAGGGFFKSWMLIGGIALIAVLLAGGLVFLIFAKKKRKKRGESSEA